MVMLFVDMLFQSVKLRRALHGRHLKLNYDQNHSTLSASDQESLISAVGRQTGKMQAFSLQTKISHRRQHGIHDTAVLFGFKAAG
jgi:hypothetical protein